MPAANVRTQRSTSTREDPRRPARWAHGIGTTAGIQLDVKKKPLRVCCLPASLRCEFAPGSKENERKWAENLHSVLFLDDFPTYFPRKNGDSLLPAAPSQLQRYLRRLAQLHGVLPLAAAFAGAQGCIETSGTDQLGFRNCGGFIIHIHPPKIYEASTFIHQKLWYPDDKMLQTLSSTFIHQKLSVWSLQMLHQNLAI